MLDDDKEVLFFKLIAFGAVVFYLYKASQKTGGTLAGNPYLKNVDPRKIARLGSVFVPPEFRGYVEKFGTAALHRMFKQ
jgi:hypothetical protein